MRLFNDNLYWVQVRDGDPRAMALFERHYSKSHYKDGRRPNRFVGPGERIVLLGKFGDALFVWRKFISDDGQRGVNCAVFRNETRDVFEDEIQVRWHIRSSELLLQAEDIAQTRWPGERFYTYVDPSKIKSTNPGYCYKVNGWRKCGKTKKRGLVILEKLPGEISKAA